MGIPSDLTLPTPTRAGWEHPPDGGDIMVTVLREGESPFVMTDCALDQVYLIRSARVAGLADWMPCGD